MGIQIYNSESQKKEDFVPLEAGRVKMYVCGPTVYDFLHVGNFRGPTFFNVVRNWLEYRGFKVDFVYNYTDVDDRIIQRANKDGKPAAEIAETYTRAFEEDFRALGLRAHTHNPKVTAFMNPIVDMIGTLVNKGNAYVLNGDVYFDVRTKTDYGRLSKKNLDDLEAGTRVDVNVNKRNPSDFALWKASKPGEPAWDSPWGQGRPGWHIECSAMARALLGDSIDIHGGGLDLIFPHHENEVAQSECTTGHPFVRYWMHNNMLNFGSQKMSKSLGNVRTVRSFIAEFHPEIYKQMMLSSHYRSVLDFTPTSIEHVVSQLARIYSAMSLAEKCARAAADPAPPADFVKAVDEARAGVEASLDDDFNTPEALARLFEVTRVFNNLVRTPGPINPKKAAVAKAYLAFARWLGAMLSLYGEPPEAFLTFLDDMLLKKKNVARADVQALVDERSAARAAKDWAKSDEIRARLLEMGIQVQDGPSGSDWEVQK